MTGDASDELGELYRKLLHWGLIEIRNAADAGDVERCRVEAEHLHNLPSLIGETNAHRHACYIAQSRTAYLEWLLAADRPEVQAFVGRAYLPLWKQIEQIVTAMNFS